MRNYFKKVFHTRAARAYFKGRSLKWKNARHDTAARASGQASIKPIKEGRWVSSSTEGWHPKASTEADYHKNDI
jgi:hypothetical protein